MNEGDSRLRGGQRLVEIVGFGALNVDYIAGASRLSRRLAEQVSESTARFEWNTEGAADEVTISKAIERLGTSSLDASLGGSAWITIFALAQMRVDVQLGYVGVAGRIETPGLSFVRQMDLLGIDRRWVARRPDRLCGTCLSYLEDAERVMLTHPGANFAMADHLRQHGDRIAGYLAQARIVHVTSFLDEATPPLMLEVLTEARRRNPALRISFDPGFDWAQHRSPAVREILALADLLFVNHREFKALGDYAVGESDEVLAARVLAGCAAGCTVFVTKRYDFVEVFRSSPAGVLAQRFQLRRPTRESALEDATGAGDVFAAAVLAAQTSRRLQVELGTFLGLSLARHRTLHGQLRTSAPPHLDAGFLQSAEKLSGPGSRPPAVLLAHDSGAQWEMLRRFLRDDCSLVVHTLGQDELHGGEVSRLFADRLARCGFAVCVLSATRVMSDGERRAGEDVVHQVGILQGHYGFGRVALLTEEGCAAFSNIAGLIRLDFSPGRIHSTFWELERMLVREGFLPPGGSRHDR
ncbi:MULTISPECIES: PfkB family carbohydrate kinase [unclassified Streptomyces]|uniref:PfkB family carbohydrate kinase n=1 Tax=unclassified Streptomyces TaxID=2593676 RepID=UPI0033EC5BDB